MEKEVTIIIPAYNPNENLVRLIENLKKNKYEDIIVIDDGSKNKNIFKKLDITILCNERNLGKGQALKNGFKYCINKDKKKIITVDADGQHLVEDVNKVYDKLINYPDSIILGSRIYEKETIPLKSRIGNRIIDFIVNKKNKLNLKDTQTGLRGFSSKYLDELITIEGQRYEYEMNMILYFSRKNIKIEEVPIKRVYFNNNKESSYRMLLDSTKIIKCILENNKKSKEYKM